MMTDSIADLLTRIRNASMMHHEQVALPHSKLKESVANVLKKEGFLKSVDVLGDKSKKSLVIGLKYLDSGESIVGTIRKVSKPSRRVYVGLEELRPFRSGTGVRILSTPKGVLSDTEARQQKVGGEILLEVW